MKYVDVILSIDVLFVVVHRLMSVVDTSLLPLPSRPISSSSSNPRTSKQLTENLDDDSQVHDVLLQHLVTKQSKYQNRISRKNNTNYISTPGSIVDRAPSSLLELKQQRLLAAADRKKRIIARIVSIVGLLIILLCAAIVALTLKMAPKIDELVRTQAGAHHLVHLVPKMNTLSNTITTTTTTAFREDNSTQNGSILVKSILRTQRKAID